MPTQYEPSLMRKVARWWNVLCHKLPSDFDGTEYLRLNPDVAKANVDPVRHFLKFGRKEGRNWHRDLPRDFNPGEYLDLNPDVAKAKADPVRHFLEFGRKEGRAWKRGVANSVRHDEIDAMLRPDIPWASGSMRSDPVLVGSHGTINIVAYLDRFWASPQALGPVNFHEESERSRPDIKSAETLDRLIALLDEPDDERRSEANPNIGPIIPLPPSLDSPFPTALPDALHEYAKIVGPQKLLNVMIPHFRKASNVFQGLEELRQMTAAPMGNPRAAVNEGGITRSDLPPPDPQFQPATTNVTKVRARNPLVPFADITEHKYAKVVGARKLISVVIPYFRKSSTIFRCLDALRDQDYTHCSRDDIEIIIVDDGTPGEAIPEKLPDDVHYVWQKKVRYGICRAKNTGAKLSNGRYIAFLDPDVIVDRLYFDSMLRGFSKYGDRIVQTGYVFGYHYFNDDPAFQNSPDPRTEFGVWENPGILTRRFYQVAGLNLAIARNLFNETPGFDEDLIYGGVEDLLFGYHVGLVPGTAVVFNREMEVQHIPHPIGGAHLNVGHTWEIVKRKWPEFYADYRENGSR